MKIERRTDEDGLSWVSCEAFTVGDYGGYGSVGEGNIRALETYAHRPDDWPEGADVVDIVNGYYWSRQAWIPDCPENVELIEGLADYPVIDEEAMTEVESEWEVEAFKDYGSADIGRALRDEYGEEFSDVWGELPTGLEQPEEPYPCGRDQFTLYRNACELTSTYPTPEYSGSALHLDRLTDAIAHQLLPMVAVDPVGRAYLESWLAEDCPGLAMPTDWVACLPVLADEATAANGESCLGAFLTAAHGTLSRLRER